MEFFPKVIVRFIFWSVVTQGHGSWTGKVCLSTKSRLYKVYKGFESHSGYFSQGHSQVQFLVWSRILDGYSKLKY